MVTTSYMPLAAILISLVAIIFIIALSKKPNLREAVTILAAIGKLAIILSMLPAIQDSRYPALNLIELAPGIQFALKVDEAGMIFALLASSLWLVTSFYSIGYMRKLDEKRQTRFYASFALCLSSTIGIAFSANLFTFYIFFEVLTIATYPLVTHEGTEEALKAGRKYLAYLLTGGVVLLAAIVYTYQITGTLDQYKHTGKGGSEYHQCFTHGIKTTIISKDRSNNVGSISVFH
jgi:multicomponent Na+:H+ antiporter subunit D